MAHLEALTRGAQVKGIVPEGLVTVVDVQWHGAVALERTSKDAAGRLGNEWLFRDREPSLKVVAAGRFWNFDADGALLRLVSEAYRIHLAYLFDPSSPSIPRWWSRCRIKSRPSTVTCSAVSRCASCWPTTLVLAR